MDRVLITSCTNRGKVTVARDIGFPNFRGLVSVNTTPSGCFFKYLISNSQRTGDRSGDTKANGINNFFVSNLSGNVLFSPKADRYVVTLDTSQVVVYLGFGGLSFAIPFINRVTRGC